MTIKKIASFGAIAAPFVAFPSRVLAQLQDITNPDALDVSNVNAKYAPLMTYTPSQMLTTVLNVMLGVAGVASFVILLWGGLQWILAGGDKEGTEKARKKITAALIGLAIVFSAYALLYIIRALFGINLIQVNIQQIGTA